MRKVLVTGGAGFIGSHIADRLIRDGIQVVVYDNFSTGQESFIEHHLHNDMFTLIRGDIRDNDRLTQAMRGCDFVFHIAANADVRGGINNTTIDLEQNIIGTHSVLEAMRKNYVPRIAFSSSSAVYGDPGVFPTPEDQTLIQTSLYGASKLSGEAMIQAYSGYFDIQCYIFRFVTWIGERYSHGVICDFLNKLTANPYELEILGDGKQRKSYLYVTDGVDGIFKAIEVFTDQINIFNLGHNNYLNVVEVANIVCDEMNLNSVEYRFTGGDRGWKGDSPFVHLDAAKLNSIGWEPGTDIETGIRRT
ncbi:MAG: SDR family NAD(P)-dependent oxidoreductase, partial [Thermoplasmata archaeon]|nr:SDR family NAD(P)-dependent oxidoreductase [Thermoplasmata archaeon]